MVYIMTNKMKEMSDKNNIDKEDIGEKDDNKPVNQKNKQHKRKQSNVMKKAKYSFTTFQYIGNLGI